LAGSPSLWLDPSLPWPSQSNPSLPLLLCRGRGHPDRHRRVRCRRPPWRGSSTTGHGKKHEGPKAAIVRFASSRRSLTLERRPLLKNRLLLRVSRLRLPRLRLPWHPGAIVFLECTPVSTLAATFAPSRRCDCGRISTRRLLPSASTPVSSCVVPPLRLRGMLDSVYSLCVCGVRHHCWAAGPLGLGF
jgi:hypothetical protein